MGEDLRPGQFRPNQPEVFKAAVRAETEILERWFEEEAFEDVDSHFGFELEGCLVNQEGAPAFRNEEFLQKANDPAIVPELGRSNFEFNSPVYERNPRLLRQILNDLEDFTTRVRAVASELQLRPLWIGILPTLRDGMLTAESMTQRNRYFALAEQVLKLREGNSASLQIERFQNLDSQCHGIMTEAAATSLQIHSQVRQRDAVRAYNASLLLAGPCTALTANSPFLYGKKLWDETRIPVFEQSLSIPTRDKELEPVTFGSGYVRKSLIEIFWHNLERHRPILPVHFESPPEKLRHLKFLNGQIWRWVRPILGVDYGEKPHIRLEQRCFPAGPSNRDTVANMAFYLGALHSLTHRPQPLEAEIPFEKCRENFYQCARLGMKASVTWSNGQTNVQSLLHDHLFEVAREGLQALGMSKSDLHYFLDKTMLPRIRTGWTGAAWQKSFIDLHGTDFKKMTNVYIDKQSSGEAVHEWRI